MVKTHLMGFVPIIHVGEYENIQPLIDDGFTAVLNILIENRQGGNV